MEPNIESKEPFIVVGMKYRGRNDKNQIPALWDRFIPREKEIQHRTPAYDSYGVMDHYDSATGHFDYVAAFEVTKVEGLPEGMVGWDIPAQKYATLEIKFSEIKEGFEKLYAWITQSGNRRAAGPEFEYYPKEFDPNIPDSLMALYIPIE